MRPFWFRVVRPLVLSLVILSCATENPVGPKTVPTGLSADIVAAGVESRLIITEVMPDPSKVLDGNGEWFEVYNAGENPVDLQGVKIVSAAGLTASESHIIAASIVVDPGEYIVFGNNINSATNGGVPVVYSYGGSIALNNGSSTSANEWLALRFVKPLATRTSIGDSVVTYDSVAYAVRVLPAAPGPYSPPAGASRGVIDLAADNTIISGSNWATSVSTYGLGDKGTPAQPNQGGAPVSATVRISWVTPGTTFRVTATAIDKDGKPAPTNFTWSSSNTGIATVDPVTGIATGVSLGVATLKATTSNGIEGTAPLFVVNPGDVASISISINDPAQVPAGFTKPAFPTSRTTTNATATPTLEWSTSDPSIATVSSLGYVTGIAAGKVFVRATAPNGVYGEVPFTVIPASATTTAIYRNHIEFGKPTPATGGNDLLLEKPQFIESYNPSRGGPNWVSWNINASHFSGVPRCDCFSADQTLPEGVYKVVDFDYRNGGYDRGHMVQSESRTTTDQENASTFLLTNILPQGGENNQGPWSKFENYLNDQARSSTAPREIYVIAGGLYSSNAPTLKDEGKVAIPEYTWKVAVLMDAGKGLSDVHTPADLQVIAIKMPNLTTPGGPASSVGIRNNAWEQYEVTVDELEAATGYDFLSALPNAIEILVEAKDRPPLAAFAATPSSAFEGGAISFDAAGSLDPDVGDVLTYSWDFGDGDAGTGVNPSHTFADNGRYDVVLTVKDKAGATAEFTSTVNITNVAPSVVIATPPTIYSGETYAFSGGFADAGQKDAPWIYVIDWGTEKSPELSTTTQGAIAGTHQYFAAGTYGIGLTVTDKDGASGSSSATLRVLRLPGVLEVNPRIINTTSSGAGQVIVTILGNQRFDGSMIDLSSIRVGEAVPDLRGNDETKAQVADVNDDGVLDLVVHFDRGTLVEDGGLTVSARTLVLQADLTDHRQIEVRGPIVVR